MYVSCSCAWLIWTSITAAWTFKKKHVYQSRYFYENFDQYLFFIVTKRDYSVSTPGEKTCLSVLPLGYYHYSHSEVITRLNIMEKKKRQIRWKP